MVDASRILRVAAVLASISLIAGCFASRPEDIEAFVKPYEVNVTAEDYIVQPPDEIEVHCSQAPTIPEIHMQRQRVRPDGKVSFEVLGEIEVAGKTPKQIVAVIEEQLKKLNKFPGDNPVDVRVAVFASKAFYVVGQVMRPGPRNYTGRDSLMTALAAAEPNPLAWEQRVQVVRPAAQEDAKPRIFEVDYEKMITRGDLTKDVLLQEGDIVYVPPTVLAAIGLVLEEFITPVARAFYGWYLVQNPPTQTQGYSPYGGTYR
jgi:polysaccharide export outer membrane protein